MTTSLEGSRKRFVMPRAWDVVAMEDAGPRARLRGRWESGSAEVGMLSGIGSDIVAGKSVQSDCARLRDKVEADTHSRSSRKVGVEARVSKVLAAFGCSKWSIQSGPLFTVRLFVESFADDFADLAVHDRRWRKTWKSPTPKQKYNENKDHLLMTHQE